MISTNLNALSKDQPSDVKPLPLIEIFFSHDEATLRVKLLIWPAVGPWTLDSQLLGLLGTMGPTRSDSAVYIRGGQIDIR